MAIKQLREYKKELENYLELINSNMNILDKEVKRIKNETVKEIQRVKRLIKNEYKKELI